MLKKTIFAAVLGAVSFIIFTPSFAGTEWCPADSVHCAYVKGLSNNPNEGKYIKISNNKINIVMCFNNSSTVALLDEVAAKFVGTNSDQYSICSDEQGSKCEPIGVDNFTVTKTGDKYTAEPTFYAIDLSKVKDKYSNCGLAGRKSIRLS